MRVMLLVALTAGLLALPVFAAADESQALPAIPGVDETPPPPLPGSTEVGKNPLNAVHLDTLTTVEALIAGGFGAGLGYERSFGTILGVEAEAGYLGSVHRSASDVWRLDLASLLGGVRLSVMQTAVNGPSLGVSAGVALAWFTWSNRLLFYLWPQARIDVGMKLSLGRGARGLFLEPRVGYKLAFTGAETQGLPIPRYGGLVAGLRAGLSF
jgi:hypothetical protein